MVDRKTEINIFIRKLNTTEYPAQMVRFVVVIKMKMQGFTIIGADGSAQGIGLL